MLNQYPWWKYALMLLVIIPGFLYALPNLYGDDPGLQIRGVRNFKVTEATLSMVKATVRQNGITPKSVIREG
ncbi:MAG TPA: protein translocase subunit SecD, partial [Gammaproteobacteria bacterium]|nr:protein translocase subunit SecD [Gammaproteobacteria bacterium]